MFRVAGQVVGLIGRVHPALARGLAFRAEVFALFAGVHQRRGTGRDRHPEFLICHERRCADMKPVEAALG